MHTRNLCDPCAPPAATYKGKGLPRSAARSGKHRRDDRRKPTLTQRRLALHQPLAPFWAIFTGGMVAGAAWALTLALILAAALIESFGP